MTSSCLLLLLLSAIHASYRPTQTDVRVCDIRPYAIDGQDTHRGYTERIHTAGTDRERARGARETGRSAGERETEKEGASKTDVGPNSLSLDSITFNRLAGPMLPGAE